MPMHVTQLNKRVFPPTRDESGIGKWDWSIIAETHAFYLSWMSLPGEDHLRRAVTDPRLLLGLSLSDVASARSPAVTRGSFLASAHRELSVALVQSQGYVYRSCALLLAKTLGRPVLPGADTPYLA
jgi:hypothetical protein